MQLNRMIFLICVLSFISVGCNTAKGFKKDVTCVVQGATAKDGWLKKSDDWVRENMW